MVSLDGPIESCHIFGELPRHAESLTLTFDIVGQSEFENDLPSELVSLDIPASSVQLIVPRNFFCR